MPSVKSSTNHLARFAPYEERAGGEAPRPLSAEPNPGADAAWNFYWEDPVAEEEVPYVAEECEVEYDAYDYQLDLPPLFEEISPRSDREGADSPSSSTESTDSTDHNHVDDTLDDPLDEAPDEALDALGDEEVVEMDGEFEMNLGVADDEDYIYDDPGAPQSPPPPLMYFGREECEEAASPDAGATTAAVREALRRVTRRLVFH